ncbi:MAG: transposase, partial [Bacteroidales bacterium]|nr:transposase [Bacteroidales bacterium]
MKRTWSIEEKIAIIKEVETQGVVETCRKHGIYASTYYDWKKKYTMG